jgi:hypothetical protein
MSRAAQHCGIIWFASSSSVCSPHGLLPSLISSAYLFTRGFTVRAGAKVYSSWRLGGGDGNH